MPKLPPRVGTVNEKNFLGFVPMADVDFTFAGYLLACHLVIEHYLDEFLRSRAPELTWEGAKLNFAQKAALFPYTSFPQGEQAIAGIRHINVLSRNRFKNRELHNQKFGFFENAGRGHGPGMLRNKLAHRMDAKPEDFDYLPFIRFLEKAPHPNAEPIPTTPVELLEAFVDKLSHFFIGWLASDAFRTTWRQKRQAGAKDT